MNKIPVHFNPEKTFFVEVYKPQPQIIVNQEQSESLWTPIMFLGLGIFASASVYYFIKPQNSDNKENNEDVCESMTGLMIACKNNSEEKVDMLLQGLQEKCDINLQNIKGWSALMIASSYRSPTIVGKLLKAGADLDLQDERGWSALMFASRYGSKEIVDMLINAGSDLDLQSTDGWSALMLASVNSQKNIDTLIKAGAIFCFDNNNWTLEMMKTIRNLSHNEKDGNDGDEVDKRIGEDTIVVDPNVDEDTIVVDPKVTKYTGWGLVF